MTDIIIYGIVQSSYVRTVRLACEEKGVSYEVQPIEFGSPEHLALHPFGKVPSARHGDVTMYETSAIVRYIDAAFDGPALQPADLLARTRMEQWISATIDYFYQDMIRELVFPRLVAPSRGAEPDWRRLWRTAITWPATASRWPTSSTPPSTSGSGSPPRARGSCPNTRRWAVGGSA
jgi:glutathione S-transferase